MGESDGSGNDRINRSDRRRSEILDAAVNVIVTRGADATRYSDVAEASGVPIGTLQYAFGSRDELLVAAFRHGAATNRAYLGAHLATLGDPWEKLQAIVAAQLSDADISKRPPSLLYVEFYRLAVRDPAIRADVVADYQGWRTMLAEVIAEGVERRQFAPGTDPDLAAMQVLSILGGLAAPMALFDPALPMETARELMTASVAALVGIDRVPPDLATD